MRESLADGWVSVEGDVARSLRPIWPPEHTRRGVSAVIPGPPVRRWYRWELRSPTVGLHAAEIVEAVAMEHLRRPSTSRRSIGREVLSLSPSEVRGLLRTEVEVRCGSTTHDAVWAGGTRLTIGDPHDDAEHVLAVLAGRATCDRVAAAWAGPGRNVDRAGRLPEPLQDVFWWALQLVERRPPDDR